MSSGRYVVRLLAIAQQDLEELVSHVAADNIPAALALADTIEARLTQLNKYPYLGRMPNDARVAGLGYRLLLVENYLIFYKVRGRSVMVHRILHGARDILSLLKNDR